MNRKNKTIKNISLLTPYTGGNYGDGAIQDAIIANIRSRCPEAKIYGVNLCPEDTAIRHNIPCVPLSARNMQCDKSVTEDINNEVFLKKDSHISLLMRVKMMLKQNRALYTCIRFIYRLPKLYVRLIAEVKHLKTSYSFLRGFDYIIAAGGGQIDDYWGGAFGHPYSLFKWAIIAKATNTRFLFLSVGVCSLRSKLSFFFIKNALKLSEYRSYRDRTSKEILKQLEFTHDDKVFPDLAFGYSPGYSNDTPSQKKIKDERLIVGISPIAYLSQYGWPEKNTSIFQTYIRRLSDFIRRLIDLNYKIMIFCSAKTDLYAIDEVINLLKRFPDINMEDNLFFPTIPGTEQLLRKLMLVDYVVASRLHGILLSHLAEKPVLAISYDRKVITHMQDMNQEQYCIDIHSFDVKQLLNKFDLMVDNTAIIKMSIKKTLNDYKAQLGYQYDNIFGII